MIRTTEKVVEIFSDIFWVDCLWCRNELINFVVLLPVFIRPLSRYVPELCVCGKTDSMGLSAQFGVFQLWLVVWACLTIMQGIALQSATKQKYNALCKC